MQLFVISASCQTRVHCQTCRATSERGRAFRASLLKVFILPNNIIDFACPYGVPWNGIWTGPVVTPIVTPIATPFIRFIARFKVTSDIGIGDTIHRMAKRIGAARLIKLYTKLLGYDCGCDQRRIKLNRLYPY